MTHSARLVEEEPAVARMQFAADASSEQEAGVELIDLNHDEPVKTPNLGRLTGLEYLFLSRTVASAWAKGTRLVLSKTEISAR